MINCKQCNNKFNEDKKEVRRGKREGSLRGRFCGRDCSNAYWLAIRRTPNAECAVCAQKFFATSKRLTHTVYGKLFCSKECKNEAQRVENGVLSIKSYKGGKRRYRIRALRQYGEMCEVCKFDGPKDMLDVHHIDGDRDNGSIDNLIVLCVWHHWMCTKKLLTINDRKPVFKIGFNIIPNLV